MKNLVLTSVLITPFLISAEIEEPSAQFKAKHGWLCSCRACQVKRNSTLFKTTIGDDEERERQRKEELRAKREEFRVRRMLAQQDMLFLCQGLEAMLKFKDNPDFWACGFDGPYRGWYRLMRSKELEILDNKIIDYIIKIALIYHNTEGKETKYTNSMLPYVKAQIYYDAYLRTRKGKIKKQ